MAAIFKRKKKDRNEPYTIQYLDHLGKRCTVKGFTDKGLTEELAARLEGEARMRQTGLIDPEMEQFNQNKMLPLEEHVTVFAKNLLGDLLSYPELQQSTLSLFDSQVTTSVQSGVGQGGNITMGSELHPLGFLIMSDGQVRADAFGGPGGNIRLFAETFLSSGSIISSEATCCGVRKRSPAGRIASWASCAFATCRA